MEFNNLRHFRDLIRKLQRHLGGHWKSDAACCGITAAQCHTLMEVGDKGEISLVELASILELDTSTLSRTVEGMVQNGLVERRPNLDDRRYLNLTLTEQGQNAYDNINHIFDRYYSELFKKIPAEKHDQVIESIDLLNQAMYGLKDDKLNREEVGQ